MQIDNVTTSESPALLKDYWCSRNRCRNFAIEDGYRTPFDVGLWTANIKDDKCGNPTNLHLSKSA